MKEIQNQFNLLESNINATLKNIKDNGIKADVKSSDLNGRDQDPFKRDFDPFRKAYRLSDKDKSKFQMYKIKIIRFFETGPPECLKLLRYAEHQTNVINLKETNNEGELIHDKIIQEVPEIESFDRMVFNELMETNKGDVPFHIYVSQNRQS